MNATELEMAQIESDDEEIEVNLKLCELLDVLDVKGGGKLIVKRLPEFDTYRECTWEDCDEMAEYVTIALGDEEQYIAMPCHKHLAELVAVQQAGIPLELRH